MADYNSTHSGATIDTTITNADASGAGKIVTRSSTDMDSISVSGFYAALNTASNNPVGADFLFYHVQSDGDNATQFGSRTGQPEFYFRRKVSSSWQPWVEVFHTDNMQTTTANGIGVVKLMKNTSGGAIADEASVAGSTISSVKFDNTGALTVIAVASGTWKSVNGASLASNESGYFVRTA